MNSRDNFITILKNNPNQNLSDYVDKQTFLSYLINPVSFDNATHVDCYDNDIFEIVIRSGNLENLQYIIDCGFNVNHNNFGDYGSLFQIALSNFIDYSTLEKQLKLLIRNSFNVNDFTLNEGCTGTLCDDTWPNLLFYVCSYSLKTRSSEDLNKLIDLLIQLGVDPQQKNKFGQCYYDENIQCNLYTESDDNIPLACTTYVTPSAPPINENIPLAYVTCVVPM